MKAVIVSIDDSAVGRIRSAVRHRCDALHLRSNETRSCIAHAMYTYKNEKRSLAWSISQGVSLAYCKAGRPCVGEMRA